MIVCAAVAPQPPLLVPELAGDAVAETADLRAACMTLARTVADITHRWLAVGVGSPSSMYGPGDSGSFAGFGCDVRVALGPQASLGEPIPDLPLPLLVAGWLRAATGEEDVEVTGLVLDEETPPDQCLERGAELAALGGPDPVALLAVGDGAATHTAQAPGSFARRAASYDEVVVDALRDGTRGPLATLEPTLSRQLCASGRVAWQVLAGALARPSTSKLLYSAAPLGVAYHVALWTSTDINEVGDLYDESSAHPRGPLPPSGDGYH